ncbi:MAG TPA: VOC family protein [Steroidobacteraceae bacterium]|nr:VOC family protein [Steroidobacteraceae bacterium]
MSHPNFVILYVDSPPRSAAFYSALLGRAPAESSPTFAMFPLDSGVMLGLWSKHTVEPPAGRDAAPGGGTELAFAVEGNARVDEMHADWRGRGLPILQAPVTLDFGYTFVALDPDQHRLRVFAPGS